MERRAFNFHLAMEVAGGFTAVRSNMLHLRSGGRKIPF
ncbi:hypothetical protein SMB34_04780 [Thalassospira permensis NBRC 106175]|uniref:Uncharacterized protein n=1 Tax=Thalassospira permensis NBRC 106175 TaxID=1353532 RepID=A0ABR4TM53_9PROT|nr:hypothetical protein SMB34_04780 [Thalassospira permensis NBRC 106175]